MNFWKKNKEKKDKIKKIDGISIKSQFDKELMAITPFTGNLKEYSTAKKIGKLNNILSIMPNILVSQTLSQAFRVVIPKGAVGNLIQYKTGLLGTPIVDQITKKITAHAGLKSLNQNAIAFEAFTLTSFVTGQYFLTEIYKELTSIKSGLNKIESMLDDTKVAEIDTAINFIEYAEKNINEILLLNEHKIATLTNVQKYTNKLLQISLYYERQIIKNIADIENKKEENNIDKKFEELGKFIKSWCICTCGYYYGRIVEIKLSENYNNIYLENTKIELITRTNFFNDNIKCFHKDLYKKFDENSEFVKRDDFEKIDSFIYDIYRIYCSFLGYSYNSYKTKNEKKAENIKIQIDELKNYLDNIYSKLCEIPKVIEKIQNLNNGFECILEDGDIYLIGTEK